MATSAEGLLGLIDDLLDFSKIEAEKMELEEIDLDLEDLIDEVAMIVGDGAHRKGIELFAYCEPGLDTDAAAIRCACARSCSTWRPTP